MSGLTLDLSPEQEQRIAARVAEILAEQQSPEAHDGWVRGQQAIADYIDAPLSRVKALCSAGRIPVEHDGRGVLGRKSELDEWIRRGGGMRP